MKPQDGAEADEAIDEDHPRDRSLAQPVDLLAIDDLRVCGQRGTTGMDLVGLSGPVRGIPHFGRVSAAE
jgi:hypothetical protein